MRTGRQLELFQEAVRRQREHIAFGTRDSEKQIGHILMLADEYLAIEESHAALIAACESMLKTTGGSEHWQGETHESLKLIEAALAKVNEPVDFSCHVCGVECSTAPNPPYRAVCEKHCDDHDYQYDEYRRGKFCEHCDQQQEEDSFDD